MARPSTVQIRERLGQGFELDRLWRQTMGLTESGTKEQALRGVVAVLESSGTSYAVIGGIAMQLYSREPRTTLDIEVAVVRYDAIPRAELTRAGFQHEGRHPHSDNWRAPGSGPRTQRTAVQFSSEDVGIETAVARARKIDVGDLQLRLVAPADLLVLKLAAAEEPRRRPSKRRQDVLDIITLVEAHPSLASVLVRQRVDRLGSKLLTLGRSRGRER